MADDQGAVPGVGGDLARHPEVRVPGADELEGVGVDRIWHVDGPHGVPFGPEVRVPFRRVRLRVGRSVAPGVPRCLSVVGRRSAIGRQGRVIVAGCRPGVGRAAQEEEAG